MPQRILVIGGTGAQGSGVVRHLLARRDTAVRVMTRNPDGSNAQLMQQNGAELVRGDLDNGDSVKAALEGCDAVFGVTNFWEHFEREYQQGKNLIDAVAATGVRHFIYSSLPSYVEGSNGALPTPHCDIKAQLESYARSLGLPATFVHVAYYYENFLTVFAPQRRDDGSYHFGFPQGETPLAAVSVEDVGGVVAALFAQRAEVIGKTVGIVGDDLPPAQYAAIMSRVLGRRVVYDYIPHAVFASLGFPGAGELANMFEFQRLYIPNRQADAQHSRALYPEMQTFEQWLRANKQRF